jgi:hypothetical protein
VDGRHLRPARSERPVTTCGMESPDRLTHHSRCLSWLVTQAKVPLIIMNVSTSAIATKSPYIASVSLTMWQSSYPLGPAAEKNNIRKVYTVVPDYRPGPSALRQELSERRAKAMSQLTWKGTKPANPLAANTGLDQYLGSTNAVSLGSLGHWLHGVTSCRISTRRLGRSHAGHSAPQAASVRCYRS